MAEMTETHPSVIGAATELGGRLIGSMPAQFLMLCIVNLVFVLGLLWFLSRQEAARERLYTPLLTACTQEIPAALVKDLLQQATRHPP